MGSRGQSEIEDRLSWLPWLQQAIYCHMFVNPPVQVQTGYIRNVEMLCSSQRGFLGGRKDAACCRSLKPGISNHDNER